MKTAIKILSVIIVTVAIGYMAYNYEFARGGLLLIPIVFGLVVFLSGRMFRDWLEVWRDTTEPEDDAYVRYFREASGQDITEVLKGEEVEVYKNA